MEKVMIICPHPDDEILGVFHKMLHADNLVIVYVSSGKPHEIKKRERAVQIIADRIRIKKTKQIFIRGKDEYINDKETIYLAIQKIVSKEKPTEIWYPEEEGYHKLHDQVYNLMLEIRTKAKRYVFPIYGRKSISKQLNRLMNLILVPFGYLWGFTPKLYNPSKTIMLSEEDSELKGSMMRWYRNAVNEKVTKRIMPYTTESWRKV